MKLTHLVYIISLFILASCSNTAIISNHWAKYVNSNPEITLLSSSLNKKPVNRPIRLIEIKENSPKRDSIIIITKTGKTYKGIVSKSDFDGYYIKIENNREIYISNLEIKSIQFIKNPTATNVQSFLTETSPDPAVIKNKILAEKVAEPNNSNSLENDVWDNTNSEFEISNSPKSVLQSEKLSRKKVQEPFSKASLVALILSPFTFGIGFLLSFIFSVVSLSRIRNNPEKYKGKTLARIIFGICLAVSLISVLLIALIIALL
jgi:hypothetical protein